MKECNYAKKLTVLPILGLTILVGLMTNLVAQENATSVSKAEKAISKDEEKDGDVIVLSPFVLNETGDSGYRSVQTTMGRSATSLRTMPTSVVVINRQLIDDLNPSHVAELLKYTVSGVSENATYFEDLTIRGFRSTNQMRNGVQLRAFQRNQLYDVERVEVLKGPGAMLFGSTSVLGGGLNYVTRRPTAEAKGTLKVNVGNRSIYGAELNSSGPLYQKDDFSVQYRGTLARMNEDFDPSAQYTEHTFVGGSLLFQFNDKVSLLVDASYFKLDGYQYIDGILDLAGLSNGIAKIDTRLLDHSPAAKDDAWTNGRNKLLSAELLVQLEEHSNLRLFYTHYDYREYERLIYGQTPLNPDGVTLTRSAILYEEPFTAIANTVQVDFIHKINFGNFTNKFLAGVDISKQDLYIKNFISFASHPLTPPEFRLPVINVLNPDFSKDTEILEAPRPKSQDFLFASTNLSYYVQNDLEFFDGKLILSGALRWIHPDGQNHDNVANTLSDTEKKTTQTHKYGIVVTPLDWLTLFYTEAEQIILRSGFLNNNNPNTPKVPIKNSEFVLNEGGIKFDYRPSDQVNLYGSVTLFDMTLTNVPTTTLDSEGYGYQVQSLGNTSKGWEADLGAIIKTDGIKISLIGTYALNKSVVATTGEPADLTPKTIYSLLVKYSVLSGALEGFTIGAGVHHQSAMRTGGYMVYQPSIYTLFSSYRWNSRWSSQLNVGNLTDERYIVKITSPVLVDVNTSRRIVLSTTYYW